MYKVEVKKELAGKSSIFYRNFTENLIIDASALLTIDYLFSMRLTFCDVFRTILRLTFCDVFRTISTYRNIRVTKHLLYPQTEQWYKSNILGRGYLLFRS